MNAARPAKADDGEMEGAAVADSTPRGSPAPGAASADGVRQQRLTRQMERGVTSLHFDSADFMTRFPGAAPDERAMWAQRLLLAVAPQLPTDPAAGSLAVVRGLMLDAAYQLK